MKPNDMIMRGFRPPKSIRPGRPKGTGKNLETLKKLIPGDEGSCVFGLSLQRKDSLRASATQQGWKVKVVRLEDGRYCLWRLT